MVRNVYRMVPQNVSYVTMIFWQLRNMCLKWLKCRQANMGQVGGQIAV